MFFFKHILGSALFTTMLSRIVLLILSAVGIGYASFTGIDFLLDSVVGYLNSQKASLSSTIAQMLHIMGVDKAINILLSSSAAIFVLKGISGGKLTKFVTGTPK